MNDVQLPDNLLVIRYQALSSEPHTRLALCGAIGRLLNSSTSQVPLSSLAKSPVVLRALRTWLNSEEARNFWRTEHELVTVIRPCTQHLLVGTRDLLQDLGEISFSSPQFDLAQIDSFWQAASHLITNIENKREPT